MLPTFLPSVRPGFGTSDDLYQFSVGLASGVLASCRQCVVCQCNWWTTVLSAIGAVVPREQA